MKKLLTVLLVIAVMFTFSFGSAFAVAKADYNETLAKTYFDAAMKAIADSDAEGISITGPSKAGTTGGTVSYFIEYKTLASFYDQLYSAAVDYAKAKAENNYVGNGASIDDFLYLVEGEGNELDNSELKMDIVAAQYKADKETAIGNLDGLSLSDYSTEKLKDVDADGCTTYLEHVQYIINEAKKDIEKATFTTDDGVAEYVAAKAVMDSYFEAYKGDNAAYTALTKEKGYMQGETPVGLGVYELNTAYAVGDGTLNAYTTAAVKGQDAIDNATIASQKAAIASEYSRYMALKDADKTFADNMKKALDFLAEEGILVDAKATATSDEVKAGTAFKYFVEGKEGAVKTAIDTVEKFEVDAARLAAEKDATGALVRDAKDVADLVTEGKVHEYMVGVGFTLPTNSDGTLKYRASQTCLEAIRALYASLDEARLDYEKKVRETYVANFLADAEADETYYPAELAKLKSLTEEYLTKVNAVTELDKVGKYDNEYFGDSVIELVQGAQGAAITSTSLVGKVEKASDVDKKAAVLYNSAEEYANIINKQIKKNDDRYYLGENYAKLHAAINELVGNSEARTTKDINAMADQALALIKNLPTNAAVDAALTAADDAVKALPKKVSTADKATIDAAKAAVKAYEDLSAATYGDKDKVNAAVLKYAYAFNNEMTAKVKAVSSTDKEAVKALKSEIKDFIKAYEYDKTNKPVEGAFTANLKDLNDYLDAIKAADKAAVVKAIAAIPERANLTEADKATVENARKLYDAYVAEYTDYEDPYPGYVADDFDYATLVKAEALLGLNANPAKAVESLKIVARSTAKKGSITVKWTVKGEADIDGYQIWKSKKANSGYKKAFTTTKKSYKNSKGLKKGTRYYYKVRAYKVIDGKNVYSDWSNKANRKAK